MTFQPAHKVASDEHRPGQLSFDRYPYLKHSTAEPQRDERVLAEYIARKADDFNYFNQKVNAPTFNSWFEERTRNFDEGEKITREDFELVASQAWKTAQEIQNGR